MYVPTNDPDITCGMTDQEMDERFNKIVEIANQDKRIKGTPLPKFDPTTKKAYLEYPDGRREYA